MSYTESKKKYMEYGIDTDIVLEKLKNIPISLQCWQGDDVGGFEQPDSVLNGGGIQTTGNFPGKARSIEQLQKDIEKVFELDGGTHRLNLHAMYGDFSSGFVDRDKIEEKHYQIWVDWAKRNGVNLDFNGTFFSHPKAEYGYTLSSKDDEIRHFWINHEKRCRRIAAWIGKQQNSPCVLDTWIPDGAKNIPVDRMGYRKRLKESLDEVFEIKYPENEMMDALETKLFGIGSEAFVVGSHEFYLKYAQQKGKMLCIDAGHFSIGENVSDKLSSILLFDDKILLHVSRPMHWDSDHVVLFNDATKAMAEEIIRSGKLDSILIGLDFFDASINRIGAWVTGSRAMRKALLFALLEPIDKLISLDEKGEGYAVMAMLEQQATLPFGDIWEEYCIRCGVPTDDQLISKVKEYERIILEERS